MMRKSFIRPKPLQTMKKTVFPLVMAALAAFPVLFSCTEKEQEISVDNHRFEYRFSLAEDATRALLNDEGVFWEAGDNVGLFTGAAQSLEAEVDAESSPKTIVVQTADPLAEGTTVYAYYPYVEGNTDVTASKVVFPAEQSGGALSAMPLAGIPTAVHIDSESSTIGVIRFLNLGSIIDFRVYSSTYAGETVESVALQANTGNLITADRQKSVIETAVTGTENIRVVEKNITVHLRTSCRFRQIP